MKNENLNKNIEASSQPAAFKWIIAVLPPIFFVIFVTFIRKAAEKAKQEEAKDSWLNSILRVNLIQQALAVSGPDKKVARGTEDNAELGKSLLSKVSSPQDLDMAFPPDNGSSCCHRCKADLFFRLLPSLGLLYFLLMPEC